MTRLKIFCSHVLTTLSTADTVQDGNHKDFAKTVVSRVSWKRIAKNLVANVEDVLTTLDTPVAVQDGNH